MMISIKFIFQSMVLSFVHHIIVSSQNPSWQTNFDDLSVLGSHHQVDPHQNYKTIQQRFNDSLHFIQPHKHEIVATNLCEWNQTKTSFTGNSIISFDIHQSDSILFYLTDQRQVHMMTDFRYNSSTGNNHWLSMLVESSSPAPKAMENELNYYGQFAINKNQMYTFDDINPSHIVLDWINNLMYLVADQKDIHVMSLDKQPGHTRTAHLIRRQSATIKKLLLCPRLSLLVWHEIAWTGMNANLIQTAQQDGTEVRNLVPNLEYRTYIEDIALDQIDSKLYILASNFVEIYQLHASEQPNNVLISRLQFNGLSRRFAILSPYLIQVYNSELNFYNLDNNHHHHFLQQSEIFFQDSKLFNDNEEFVMLSPQRQPLDIKARCPKNKCKEICVPNGQISPFTCLCYGGDLQCDDYGHHYYTEWQSSDHSEDEAQAENDPIQPIPEPESNKLSHSSSSFRQQKHFDVDSYKIINTSTDSEFSEDFLKNVQSSTTTTTTTTTESLKEIDTNLNDITKKTYTKNSFNLTNRNSTDTNRHRANNKHNLDAVSFWIRLMLFGLNRFKTLPLFSETNNSSPEIIEDHQFAHRIELNHGENLYPFLRVFDQWIYQHKLALICLIGIALVALMVIVIFVMFLLHNILSTKIIRITNHQSNGNQKENNNIKNTKKGHKPKSIEVLAVNKHFRQAGSCTGFEMNDVGHYATSKQLLTSKLASLKKVIDQTEQDQVKPQLVVVPQICSWTVLKDGKSIESKQLAKSDSALTDIVIEQHSVRDPISNWEYQNISGTSNCVQSQSSYVNFETKTPLYL